MDRGQEDRTEIRRNTMTPPDTMTATDTFFDWFYNGMGGLGGWFLFMIIALAAVIFVIYDSSSRRLPSIGWRLGVILTTALLIPAIVYRFSGIETQASIENFKEGIFYLGLLGGVIPPVLAIGYFVTFRGLVGCVQGHVHDRSLDRCPECARLQPQPVIPSYPPPQPPPPRPARPPAGPPPATKPKAHAWLVAEDGHSYQLFLGETTLGRSSQSDIRITDDKMLGRQHAKIMEDNNHFRILDLGSKNGTRVNGRLVREPVMLEPDDQIQLGDNTRLRFVR
jgi:hypothetical protein